MKISLRSLVIVLPLFTLMACERVSFDSTLDVYSPLKIKSRNDSLSLDTGKLDAQFIIKGKKNFELKIEGDNERTIKFPIPSSVELPRYNGEIFIAANDLEQDFDLAGAVRTNVDTTSSQTVTEDCTVKTGTRRICRMEPGPVVCQIVNGREVCTTSSHEVCTYEDIFEHGEHEVTFHYQTSQTGLDLEFKASGCATVLAHLKGNSNSQTSKIVENETKCRLFHHYPY